MDENEADQTEGFAQRVMAKFSHAQVDLAMELGDAAPEEALHRLEHLFAHAEPGKTAAVRFDAPKGDGRESLFQPVGRRLRQAMADGLIREVRPLEPLLGLGFSFRFAGREG